MYCFQKAYPVLIPGLDAPIETMARLGWNTCIAAQVVALEALHQANTERIYLLQIDILQHHSSRDTDREGEDDEKVKMMMMVNSPVIDC